MDGSFGFVRDLSLHNQASTVSELRRFEAFLKVGVKLGYVEKVFD